MYVYLKCNPTTQHRDIALMFALLGLAVVLMKLTLLSGMFYNGRHKHAFPTSADTHFPESNAPGDGALPPDSEALLETPELRPALTAEPHGHFNEKDYLAPGATLQPTASPEGAEESAAEKRRRGATDNRTDTSLLFKPFPARGTWETQRVSDVPPVTHLRGGLLRARSRKTWRGHLTQSSWARATPAPPARATPSADPAPDRRTQCKHSAPAASPPGVGWGKEGAERSRGPTFLRLWSRSGGKGEEGEGEGRRGSDQPRGPAACARVRGGKSCPGARRSRPRPAPAYLPGSLRRFAPPAPS